MRLHPAVVIALAFVIGSAGRDAWPIALAPRTSDLLQRMGGGLIVVGFVTAALAYLALVRFRQPIDPRTPPTRLLTGGVYRLSRNPIYLGWFIVLLGAGLENGSVFQSTSALVMIGVLHWAVVMPEERSLRATFGDEYLRYQQRVRRWL